MYKKEYELAKAWISAKNNLELKMEVLEELIAKCTDEAKAAKAKNHLQAYQDQYDTACEYQYKLEDPDNNILIQKLLVSGEFVPIKTAEEIEKEYNQDCIFNSEIFQHKKSIYKTLSTVIMVLTPFFFPQIFYALVIFLIKSNQYGHLMNFVTCLFSAYFVWAYSAIISIPIGFAIGFLVFPKLLAKIIFGSEVPPEVVEEQKESAFFGIASEFASGIAERKGNRKTKVKN
ncbi:hypothetical protein [Treponema sp.]|uniref:hypothetical protein n=1 Tax=Treponema sp. TaxID=166 RepID=UPI00298E030C|nr:hypothetical protein [Treponema sp.]